MSSQHIGTVKVKAACVPILVANLDRISVLFAAELKENGDRDAADSVAYDVLSTANAERISPDFVNRLQKYVDDVCADCCSSGGGGGGDDSSYDSDYEADAPHAAASRTASDTLAAEYDDEQQPGYTARVEFALKLGYTERLVRAALHKLGPAPHQNELLAELIRLGARKGGGSRDASPPDEPPPPAGAAAALRPIVIDGSNVAMAHGNKEVFSCRGIRICVDWFRARGHTNVTVFVPKWRKEAPRPNNLICDRDILGELEREKVLTFTPSRLVGGKRMVCYDDRYILNLALEEDGIVVSNDNYRDLCQEKAEYRKVVEERLLMYSFVNDRFMPPDDPLGRAGPTLDAFLRARSRRNAPTAAPCPYAKKCTYGNKCKYHHPERGPLPHKTVTEKLSEHAQRHLQARESDGRKAPLGRTRSNAPPPKEAQHALVSKSRSVDNVVQQQQQQPENLHRKLQRQLTLNPRHRAPPPATAATLDVHPHVTRIASDPCRAAPVAPAPARRSDTQLNVWPSPPPPPVWMPAVAHEDARRNMFYRLAAIFSEEQVAHAMQMYPDETNPQKICAAILLMFPTRHHPSPT